MGEVVKIESYIGGVTGQPLRAPERQLYLIGMKRACDLVLAVLVAPFILPIILALYIAVRLDGGPGFFGQERVGRGGRRFTCWKMRTMVVDAEQALQKACESDPRVADEWDRMQKLENDPRVTRIGRFLRETSLDELPQIWNVIRGDMSFIGPRPFMVDQQQLYLDAGGGDGYFKMRPGISGLWQTEGRGTTTFISRIRYDNEYYAKVSLLTDLKIVLKTILVVLRRTGG